MKTSTYVNIQTHIHFLRISKTSRLTLLEIEDEVSGYIPAVGMDRSARH